MSVILNGNDISQSLFLPNPPVARPPGAVLTDDIAHDQVRGLYRESLYSFSPADIQLGDNVLLLRVDGSKPTDGLMYDCLRMEIRADSALLAAAGDPNHPLPPPVNMNPGNPLGPHLKVTATYQGDPSGDYRSVTVPRQ